MTEPLVVRPKDARRMLAGCSKKTLWRLIKNGALSSYKEGSARMITVESINRHIKQRLEQGRPSMSSKSPKLP